MTMKITKLGRAYKKSGYNEHDINTLNNPLQRVQYKQQILFLPFTRCNGAFTLPDTETETDTDTNKLAQNPVRVCVDVCPCAVWTPLHNPFLSVSISVSVPSSVNTPQAVNLI